MLAADVPSVGRLFLKIFREVIGEANPDLVAYLGAIAFRSPVYQPETGSRVFVEPNGSISSILVVVPIKFIICDKVVTGRLMCAFMTNSSKTGGGAGALSLTLRSKMQDFAFTDSASPSSLRHFFALGGQTVTLQNLRWVRTFRPIGAVLEGLFSRILRGRGHSPTVLTAPLDRLLRRCRRRIGAPGIPRLSVEPMSDESFFDHAPGFVARYAVRPEWSRDELVWLLHMARQNRTLGQFAIDAITDSTGRTLGCFVYYALGQRTAHVLNVLALEGQETDVLAAMFSSFDRRGFLEARGRAQPVLMEGLALQSLVSFRHEAFVCVSSRHADVVDAVRRGDVYLGGLAGEGWSRLMTDFR